jgi:hypothetical protein
LLPPPPKVAGMIEIEMSAVLLVHHAPGGPSPPAPPAALLSRAR